MVDQQVVDKDQYVVDKDDQNKWTLTDKPFPKLEYNMEYIHNMFIH